MTPAGRVTPSLSGSPAAPMTVDHGPRTDLLVVATVPTAAVGLLLLLGWIFLPKFPTVVGVSGVVESLVFLALLSTWVWASQGAEQVVLSAEGIQPRKRIWGTPVLGNAGPLVRWEWLDPVARGPMRLGFAHFRWHRPGGYLDWYRLSVTPTQAAAIRAYPACPATYRDPGTPGG